MAKLERPIGYIIYFKTDNIIIYFIHNKYFLSVFSGMSNLDRMTLNFIECH